DRAVDDRRQHAGIGARAENRGDHRHRHGQRGDREHRLSRERDAAEGVAGGTVLGHRVLDRFALADEIEHHHRVGEQRDERREDAERKMARDVGAAQTDDRCRDESTETEQHRGEKSLSHCPAIMSPSPFVAEWVARLAHASPRGRALDVAMGRGRHALALARAGFRTFGVDIRHDAVSDAMTAAAAEGLTIAGWCGDLTRTPLPRARFDVIVVCRYLQRDLFGAIRDALAPGGAVIYETFTTVQRALGGGPTSPDHLLEPGELARHFEGFERLFYEETGEPEAVARVVGRKWSGGSGG